MGSMYFLKYTVQCSNCVIINFHGIGVMELEPVDWKLSLQMEQIRAMNDLVQSFDMNLE